MAAGNPHSMELLRMDCWNVTSFFGKRGAPVMSVRQLFDFIINGELLPATHETYIADVRRAAIFRWIVCRKIVLSCNNR
jgi:RIO kinase 1